MDLAISVFSFESKRGYFVPPLNLDYLEKETGLSWTLTCGGTRGYAVRHGEKLGQDLGEQAADSHFMMRRMESSLLLGGAGLYRAMPAGRLLFSGVCGSVKWDSQLNWPDIEAKKSPEVAPIYDWFKALSSHTILRRAADDTHLALSNPCEALVFVYRGLEWLVFGMGGSWDDLARDLGVPTSDLKDLKKLANLDSGVRHATKTGLKLRADSDNYGTWVCALFEAINTARARLEPGFTPMTPHQVSDAVLRAFPPIPYE